jgi:hypothetical protein
MNVFDLRDRLVGDYGSYTRSFIKIADHRISEKVDSELDAGAFWLEPMLQLNPTFLPGGTIDELVTAGGLHAECGKIFRIDKSDTDHTGKPLLLYAHQREAIDLARMIFCSVVMVFSNSPRWGALRHPDRSAPRLGLRFAVGPGHKF